MLPAASQEASCDGAMSRQLAVERCPAEVELELAVGGRLLFVSDLHLSGGGPTSDFAATDELVELVDSLNGHPGPVMLVLGGDILDLLQAQGRTRGSPSQPKGRIPGQQPQAGLLDRVLAGSDAIRLGRALRRLTRGPDARVVYLVGNHDAALAWDAAARRRVIDHFGVTAVALRLAVRVEGGVGEPLWLVAEHGDAFDPYNRRTDPFDPLDSPPGEHVVVELVNRLEAAALVRPDLALDQVNNVRPTALVPSWLVANYFYRFLHRALSRFALPLLAAFVLLHLPVAALVLGDLSGRFTEVGELGVQAVRWALAIVIVDLVLLGVLAAFLGRSLQHALAAYGVPAPSQDDQPDPSPLPAGAAPGGQLCPAQILVTGHTHQARFARVERHRVVVDAGCWVQALVPVRAWLGLPPVFVPAYPCTWVDATVTPAGMVVSLWERRLPLRRQLTLIERLVTTGRLPRPRTTPPHVVTWAVITTRPVGSATLGTGQGALGWAVGSWRAQGRG
jgi:UDP-2,3-diacylglucosamine pyrophosphatase LpxH